MKKILLVPIMVISFQFFSPLYSHASIFGEENIALSQILLQNIKQLIELQRILKNGKDTLGLLEEVNQGIRDCLSILDTLNVHIDPGVFSDVRKIEEIYRKIEEIYGKIPNTPAKETQILHDQSVAEAMQMHNDLYQYSAQLDQEGERIKNHAKVASPGGAQKLAAQSNGAILQALSQMQRNQAMMIKLMAEQVGMKNRDEKVQSEQFQYQYESLGNAFSTVDLEKQTKLSTLR